MTKFDIICSTGYTNDCYVGCTRDMDTATYDVVVSYDSIDEAREALSEYRCSYQYKCIQYGRRLYLVEEYYIEEVVLDEDGEVTDWVGVWEFAERFSDGWVLNGYREYISFDVAAELMDDEICELVHNRFAPCTDQAFFDAYCELHLELCGEEFELAKENPVW